MLFFFGNDVSGEGTISLPACLPPQECLPEKPTPTVARRQQLGEQREGCQHHPLPLGRCEQRIHSAISEKLESRKGRLMSGVVMGLPQTQV